MAAPTGGWKRGLDEGNSNLGEAASADTRTLKSARRLEPAASAVHGTLPANYVATSDIVSQLTYFQSLNAAFPELCLSDAAGNVDADDNIWSILFSYLSESPTLARYARWILHSGSLRSGTTPGEFRKACFALHAAVTDKQHKLPDEFRRLLVDYDACMVAANAWEKNLSTAHRERLRFKSFQAFRDALQDDAVRKNMANLGLPLLEVHKIIQCDEPPEDAAARAVWEEFVWIRALHAALRSGVAAFRTWLHTMTHVDAMHVPEMPTLYETDYHWIGRHRRMPGVPCGSRLQAFDGTVWSDTAASTPLEQQHFVRRVIVSYSDAREDEETVDRVAALLVKVPFTKAQAPASPTGSEFVSHPLEVVDELGETQRVYIKGHPVHYLPIALTVPRLHFLERVAQCFEKQRGGILLSGVHGAGKSAMLQALVSILSVGGSCDVLFAPNAAVMAELSWPHVLGAAAFGSGPLSRQMWDGEMGQDCAYSSIWRDVAEDTALRGARVLKAVSDGGDDVPSFIDGAASSSARSSGLGAASSACARTRALHGAVVVLDEVNDLLKIVRASAPPARGRDARVPLDTATVLFWDQWLAWNEFSGDEGRFRILAASPHGEREKIKEGPRGNVEFELRPAPADHLAAVMEHAPAFLCGALDVSLPNLSTQDCFAICDGLGGNARYISKFIHSVSADDFGNKTKPMQAFKTHAASVRKLMFDRFIASLSGKHWCGGSDLCGLLQLAVLDASMVVRKRANVAHNVLLAGYPALLALLDLSAAAVLEGNKVGLRPIIQTICKYNFEEAAVLAACQGAIARRMRQLCMLASVGALEAADRRAPEKGHGVREWDKNDIPGATPPLKTFQMSNAAGRSKAQPTSILSGDFVLVMRKLLPSQGPQQDTRIRCVFQTVTNFPGIDAVLVEVYGTTINVTFIEVTVSTLSTHARSRKAVLATLHSTSDDPGTICTINTSSVLRDVFASCGVGATRARATDEGVSLHFLKKHASTPVTRQSARREQEGAAHTHVYNEVPGGGPPEETIDGTSTVNCLLAAMGVPLIVTRRLRVLTSSQASAPAASGAGSTMTIQAARDLSVESDTSSTAARMSSFGSASPISESTPSSLPVSMDLRVEDSRVLCDQLHGQNNWEVPGELTWSFRMLYVTSTSAWDNLSSDFASLRADFVHGVFKDDLWLSEVGGGSTQLLDA